MLLDEAISTGSPEVTQPSVGLQATPQARGPPCTPTRQGRAERPLAEGRQLTPPGASRQMQHPHTPHAPGLLVHPCSFPGQSSPRMSGTRAKRPVVPETTGNSKPHVDHIPPVHTHAHAHTWEPPSHGWPLECAGAQLYFLSANDAESVLCTSLTPVCLLG